MRCSLEPEIGHQSLGSSSLHKPVEAGKSYGDGWYVVSVRSDLRCRGVLFGRLGPAREKDEIVIFSILNMSFWDRGVDVCKKVNRVRAKLVKRFNIYNGSPDQR